jgi:hypothetical protein
MTSCLSCLLAVVGACCARACAQEGWRVCVSRGWEGGQLARAQSCMAAGRQAAHTRFSVRQALTDRVQRLLPVGRLGDGRARWCTVALCCGAASPHGHAWPPAGGCCGWVPGEGAHGATQAGTRRRVVSTHISGSRQQEGRQSRTDAEASCRPSCVPATPRPLPRWLARKQRAGREHACRSSSVSSTHLAGAPQGQRSCAPLGGA